MAKTPTGPIDLFAYAEKKRVSQLHEKPSMPLVLNSNVHSTQRHQVNLHLETIAGLGEFAKVIAREYFVYATQYKATSLSSMLTPIRRLFESFVPRLGTSAPTRVEMWDKHDWWQATRDWAAEEKRDTSIVATTRHTYILDASHFLVFLQGRGVIPAFATPRGIKNVSALAGRKLSVAEVVLDAASTPGLDIPMIAKLIENEDDEVKETWADLQKIQEIRENPEKILAIIDYFFDEIDRAVQAEARAVWNDFAWANQAIANGNIHSIREFIAQNGGRTSRPLGSGRGSQSIFTDHRPPGQQGNYILRRRNDSTGITSPMGNLLCYLHHEFGGMVPGQREDPQIYRLISNKYGIEYISRHLSLTAASALPFAVIFLMDLAMNVGSLYDMEESFIENGIASGHVKISWWKDRAKTRMSSKELPTGSAADLRLHGKKRIAAPVAFDCLKKMRKRLAPHVFENERSMLFLVRAMGGRKGRETGAEAAQPLTGKMLRNAWEKFKERVPALRGIPLRMDQIRTTILLATAVRTKSILAVNDVAQHTSLSTSARYVETHAVRAMNRESIRAFQQVVFVAATESRQDIQRRFGVPAEVAETIRERNKRVNFGISCRDNTAGVAPRSKVGEECGDSDFCAFCKQSYVVEDVEVATQLWAFWNLISGQADRLQRDAPERWKGVWAPTLGYVAAALDAMNEGIRARGKKLAAEVDLSDIVLT